MLRRSSCMMDIYGSERWRVYPKPPLHLIAISARFATDTGFSSHGKWYAGLPILSSYGGTRKDYYAF